MGRKKIPAKGSRVFAPGRIESDPEHGVGEVPAGTAGTITRRPVRCGRDGYVEITWDNGARFYTAKWAAVADEPPPHGEP